MKPAKLTNAMVAKAIGHTVAARVHADAERVWFLDEAGTFRCYRDGALADDFTAVNEKRESLHYSEPLYAVADVAAFLGDAKETSERAMAWSGRGADYREAIRYGARVLVMWGRNNARTLQSVGITFADEAAATAFVASFRAHQPAGFVAGSSHYLPGYGGVAREYWPPKSDKKVTKHLGHVLDSTLAWTVARGNTYDRDDRDFPDAAAAAKAFDAKELALFKRGGRPYEVEWMKHLRSKGESTLVEVLERDIDKAKSGRAFAIALLEGAGLGTDVLAKGASNDEICEAIVRGVPAVHWLRGDERVGKIATKKLAKGTGYYDKTNHVVASIGGKPGGRVIAKVTRAKDAAAAAARWAKLV